MQRNKSIGRFLFLGLIGAAAGFLVAVVLRDPDLSFSQIGIFGLTTFSHAIELFFAIYASFFVLAAVRYWMLPAPHVERSNPPPQPIDPQPAAIVYLCCGDIDERALLSLSRLRYAGPLIRVIHDDSAEAIDRERVDEAVAGVEAETGVVWRLLRRPEHVGGKPGALNYVLEETAGEHEIFLIADNDSTADDPDLLTRVAPDFLDPDIAGVQFRNRGLADPRDNRFATILTSAVDIFDALMSGLFVWLWTPFVGHNAVLRTRDVLDAGAFTPGVFADDIDLTARLSLAGKRIMYRRDLVMYERHPDNYRSFCLRSTKWAHGCAQVLFLHSLPFLKSRRVSMRAKLGFLLFTGFYLTQAAMLVYMVLTLVVLPWIIRESWAPWWALLIATSIPIATFFPVLTFLFKQRREIPFGRTLLACVITYGSMDVWTVAGLWSGFRNKARAWIPTNRVNRNGLEWIDWAHFAAGIGFVIGPLAFQPQLLLLPLTWIFVGKYLFVPTVATIYVSDPTPSQKTSKIAVQEMPSAARNALLALLCIGFSAIATTTRAETPLAAADVEVRGGQILVDDQPYITRGVHYSPWRPGTGPGRGFDYPTNIELAQDLDMIRELHANTILAYDPPRRLLDLAAQRGLRVIYTFHIFWWQVAGEGEDALEKIAESISNRVRDLGNHPALLAWMIGNEVPGWVVEQLGSDAVAGALSEFRRRIRAAGSSVPVCHGNWPLTRTFDLDRDMDILCYNVYPFYPTEVAAAGYERYLRNEVLSRANGRPVLVTEFGINTIEASESTQATVIRRCWEDLLAAGAQGGVVFSFADEWWKNYNGPIKAPDWWRRQEEPDDHLSQDEDPEEHYGLVTSERVPKPAYSTVKEMFRKEEIGRSWITLRRATRWGIGAGAIAIIALALWVPIRASRRASKRPRTGVISTLFLVAGPALLGPLQGQAQAGEPTLKAELLGATLGDNFGNSVAGGGDIDGDGLADVAVGAIYASFDLAFEGAVFVFLGQSGFFDGSPLNAAAADFILEGNEAESQFGVSVAQATDLDQDGLADVVVGARINDLAASNAGAAFVHFGGPGMATDPPLALLGEASNDWFGQSVASANDVNGDGFPDVVVGAPYNDAQASAAGRAYVFFGGNPMNPISDVILEGAAQPNAHFGWSVSGAGDVNQDGFDDVIVGARLHGTGQQRARGRAYLFFGGDPMDSVPDVIFEGEAKDDWFGESVAGAGDVDADGFDDVIVGAVYADPPTGSAAGKAYLFRGGAPPDAVADVVVEGPHADAQLGYAVAGGGDLNGDGYADAVVGVHFAEGPAAERAIGEAWVIFGGAAPDAVPDLVIRGEAADDQLGESVAFGASPTGNTAAVVLAGAHFADDLGDGSGKAIVTGILVAAPVPGIPALALAALAGMILTMALLGVWGLEERRRPASRRRISG